MDGSSYGDSTIYGLQIELPIAKRNQLTQLYVRELKWELNRYFLFREKLYCRPLPITNIPVYLFLQYIPL